MINDIYLLFLFFDIIKGNMGNIPTNIKDKNVTNPDI